MAPRAGLVATCEERDGVRPGAAAGGAGCGMMVEAAGSEPRASGSS
jgi:hypothetical protein